MRTSTFRALLTRLRPRPTAAWVALGFAIIYLVWGSTYLAIRVAIETLPPLLMTGARFFIAGLVMVALTWRAAEEPVTAAHWRGAARVGGLMMAGGTGLVSWAEQWVPSGIAALLIVTVPMWMVLLDWAAYGGPRPGRVTALGVVLGMAGVALLVGPGEILAHAVSPLGAAVILAASLSWSLGSLESRRSAVPRGASFLGAGMRQLAAGAILLAAGLAIGEGARVDLAAVSARSWLAFGYLIVFGSMIAITAYLWLLTVAAPAKVATYAYVNPIVAIALGWALAGEPVGWNTVVASVLIIGAVAVVTRWGPKHAERASAAAPAAEQPVAVVSAEPAGPFWEQPAPLVSNGPTSPSIDDTTRVRRHPERGRYDRAAIDAILDEGLVCHVGIVEDGRPLVIPMGYGRDGDRLILHGAPDSRLMRALASGTPACVTVTHLDGLVLARSTMHHSMNFRSVVVMGRAVEITHPGEKRAALDAIVEHLVPGRTGEVRASTDKEVAATRVVALPIDAASAKVREGPPKDAPEDLALPVWAGVVPLEMVARRAIPDPMAVGSAPASDIPARDVPLPGSVVALMERAGSRDCPALQDPSLRSR